MILLLMELMGMLTDMFVYFFCTYKNKIYVSEVQINSDGFQWKFIISMVLLRAVLKELGNYYKKVLIDYLDEQIE